MPFLFPLQLAKGIQPAVQKVLKLLRVGVIAFPGRVQQLLIRADEGILRLGIGIKADSLKVTPLGTI